MSVVIEQLGLSPSAREARATERARRRAVDGLGGRTVWCIAALPERVSSSEALRACLSTDEGVAVACVELSGREPRRRRPEPSARTRRRDRDAYDEEIAGAEALLSAGIRADDVVVLHDASTATLAPALRARGVHVVWRGRAPDEDARAVMASCLRSIDAYLTAWREPHGVAIGHVAAMIPASSVVTTRDVARGYDALAWASALADVVQADRDDTVGGTFRARPAVAAR
jgi:hypothetical protein